jgi:AraC-like DNA-binding protein
MHDFYRKALTRLLLVLVASCFVAYFCVTKSYLNESLLPSKDGVLAWQAESRVDSPVAGRSTIQLRPQDSSFGFEFKLTDKQDRAAASMTFKDKDGPLRLVDLSRYSTISFVARCTPANTMSINFSNFMKSVSKKEDFESYLTAYEYFSCGDAPSKVELDLNRLSTGEWWFDKYNVDLSQRSYKLDGVSKIEFTTTFRSPVGVDSRLQIVEVTLNGRDLRYLYLLAAYLLLASCGYGLWLFQAYSRALRDHLRDKMQRDPPLIAYQQLSIEPHRDKEKNAILRLMATRYADPDLDLDTIVAETGANRHKINEILKTELGSTFSTALNKLRLTEAARLLAEKDTATIGEIAYSVGYKNITYFNRLFKEEYNCTPKAFREVYKKQA